MLATDCDQMLLEHLNRHPHLRARMESLLEVVEDAAGDCEKANVAERRVIEARRQMGNEALTAWAEHGVEESGRQWWRCAAKAGFGPGSHLHAVGDGEPGGEAIWSAGKLLGGFLPSL